MYIYIYVTLVTRQILRGPCRSRLRSRCWARKPYHKVFNKSRCAGQTYATIHKQKTHMFHYIGRKHTCFITCCKPPFATPPFAGYRKNANVNRGLSQLPLLLHHHVLYPLGEDVPIYIYIYI